MRNLAVRPSWPRQTKRMRSQKGRLALGSRVLSGSDGLSRFPACDSCTPQNTPHVSLGAGAK